jgi:hypothetical protein
MPEDLPYDQDRHLPQHGGFGGLLLVSGIFSPRALNEDVSLTAFTVGMTLRHVEVAIGSGRSTQQAFTARIP